MDKERRQLVHFLQQLWWAQESLAHQENQCLWSGLYRTRPETPPARRHLPHCPQAADLCTTSETKGCLQVSSQPAQDWICISSSNLVLNLLFPSYICWMCFPQDTFLQTFPSEWRETCRLPLPCSQPWLAKAAPKAFHTNLLGHSICAMFLGPACREMPAQLLCKPGDWWRCHALLYCLSSNALKGTAALMEITPAPQIGDITLLILTSLSFITEDPMINFLCLLPLETIKYFKKKQLAWSCSQW